jgi:hypothetical protein
MIVKKQKINGIMIYYVDKCISDEIMIPLKNTFAPRTTDCSLITQRSQHMWPNLDNYVKTDLAGEYFIPDALNKSD